MGLFSSSKSSTSNITTTQNTGFSDVTGQALAIQGDGNRVQFTDQGALKVAGAIADRAFGFADASNRSAAQGVAQAVEAVAESARTETENLAKNLKSLAFMAILAWAVIGFAKQIKGRA